MSSELDFSWDEALKTANAVIYEQTGDYLSDREVDVLRCSWDGDTYEQMAEALNFTVDYLRKDVGYNLWNKLSEALGERVSKTNFKEAFKRARDKRNKTLIFQEYYIERPEERKCYSKILEAGAVLRIKAPKYTGKTLLLKRMIDYCQQPERGYQTALIDFETASRSVFSDYSKFLKWFCLSASRRLNLENKVSDYWDDDLFDENENTKVYFEDYLLTALSNPVVLVLKNVDCVFELESLSIDFCKLLRAWSQYHTNSDSFAKLWKKLRLIIVHSTDRYGTLDINYSPLDGVGETVALSDFTQEQVKDLANRYQISLQPAEFQKFREMFGGHPHLVQKALAYLKAKEFSLDKILEISPTEQSPFCNHLREELDSLNRSPELSI
ncbi:MAG: AAA-like domain-containing protein [Actinomycetota bacterium]